MSQIRLLLEQSDQQYTDYRLSSFLQEEEFTTKKAEVGSYTIKKQLQKRR